MRENIREHFMSYQQRKSESFSLKVLLRLKIDVVPCPGNFAKLHAFVDLSQRVQLAT